MKMLIVEDDQSSRLLMKTYLTPLGKVDLAGDGYQALDAFRLAWEDGEPYDLICLDIMMPGIDGHAVLREIRAQEEEWEIFGRDGVKVIMTTAVSNGKDILEAFRFQCESYLIKPVARQKLFEEIGNLGLKC